MQQEVVRENEEQENWAVRPAGNSRLIEERDAWRKKYEEVFQEQCQFVSVENSLRARVRDIEHERDKFMAMTEAQKEIIRWLLEL